MLVLSALSEWNQKRFSQFVLAVVLLFAGKWEAAAQTEISKEYQVKAVFLFNFAQFVSWPPQAFADAQSPLVIGVLGDDPFDAFLDATVSGEKVKGHPLIVQRYRSVEDIKTCHILFISQSESKQMEQILDSVKGRNMLTVADSERFARGGGVIQFVTEENKIHFRINLEAAKSAGLTISSQMLRLAEIVTPGNK